MRALTDTIPQNAVELIPKTILFITAFILHCEKTAKPSMVYSVKAVRFDGVGSADFGGFLSDNAVKIRDSMVY